MSAKKSNIPALRFPEFSGEWGRVFLGNCAIKIGSGKTPSGGNSVYQNAGIPFIRSQNIKNNSLDMSDLAYISDEINRDMKSTIVNPKDILLNITGASIGRSCVVPIDFEIGNVNQHVCIIRVNEKANPCFVQLFISSEKGQKLIQLGQTGSGREGLNFQSIRKFKINLPCLKEQQKIAKFLGAVDEKIAQLGQKKALLERYKKGVMQQIFTQKLRFRDDNGNPFPDWEVKPLNNFLYETKVRNYDMRFDKDEVLSVSGEKGIVNQIDHLGRSYAGELVDNYHVVEIGNIVYTKSPLKSNPYGIIKVNKGKAGIVSTLYAVYGTRDNACGAYFDYYFQLDDNTNRYLRPIVRKGAKNDMKVNNADVLKDNLCVPSLKEQQKIAAFLSALDDKIAAVNTQLSTAQAFKKGLLQQMFV